VRASPLPFVGKVHVAYIPRGKVVGLSKIPRGGYVRTACRCRNMTNEIADALHELDAVGVMVVLEGQHSCAALRGVKKHKINMVTTAKRGEFRTNRDLRDEFYRLAGL
jgi:GTP cyclohydrolase I